MRRGLLCVMLFWASPVWAEDRLHVQGNQIYYGDKPVLLQGVAVGDPIIAREKRPLSDYEKIADDWHSNMVRISIHPGTWRDYGRKQVMEALKDNVKAAEDAGMFVIIVWQAIGVPDAYMQKAPDHTTADDLYDTDFELAKDFWRQVGKEFGQDGRVMFELWNEPVWPEMEDGTQINPHWDELKPLWLTLVGLVRFYSQNVVILTSNGWGYNIRGIRQDPIDDQNTAYAWHVYAGTDDNDPALWEKNLDGLNFNKPVIVTEWGFDPEPGKKTSGTAEGFGYLFADRFIRDKHLSYTAWCWHPVWTPPMLESDWSTPTIYGAFIKAILWRNADPLVRPDPAGKTPGGLEKPEGAEAAPAATVETPAELPKRVPPVVRQKPVENPPPKLVGRPVNL